MKDMQNIQIVLLRIGVLLRLGGVGDWAGAIEKLHAEIASEPNAAASRILSLYGGMGSFNDIVLYKNGAPMVNENNELDDLRTQLYELCHAI